MLCQVSGGPSICRDSSAGGKFYNGLYLFISDCEDEYLEEELCKGEIEKCSFVRRIRLGEVMV